MKIDFEQQRDVWGPLYTLQLKQWSQTVLQPAYKLKMLGLLPLNEYGSMPPQLLSNFKGPEFTKDGIFLKKLAQLPADYDKVKYFDVAAGEYQTAVAELKLPVWQTVLPLLQKWLSPQMRIAEVACGPGYEAIELAKMVPGNEVVAIDLSTEMITLAYRNAKDNLLSNIGFYQADVQHVPSVLHHQFDVVFCHFSFGYFDDAMAAIQNMHYLLADNGAVIMIEPEKTWYNELGLTSAKAAMPTFSGYYSREEMEQLFRSQSFQTFYSQELLPGISVCVARK